MTSPAEEIRRQLAESARVKQSFSDELIGRIAQFAEKSAAALRAGDKIVFFGNGGSAEAPRTHCISLQNWWYGFERNVRDWRPWRSLQIPQY